MASIIRGRSQHARPASGEVQSVPFDLQDMSSHADHYVQRVRDEAAKIVQQAHEEADKVRASAEKAGRLAAESAIEQVLAQRVGKEIDKLRPAVDQIVQQLAEARGEWLDHWQSAAVTLAVKIAERLVRAELERKPEISQEWVREALSLAAGGGDMTVKLHPGDYAHLAPRAEEIAQSMGAIAESRIVADAEVTPGGCVVETRYGSVDMRLESQLQQIAEELS